MLFFKSRLILLPAVQIFPHKVLLAPVPDVLDDPADRQQDGPARPHLQALHPHLPRLPPGRLTFVVVLTIEFSCIGMIFNYRM